MKSTTRTLARIGLAASVVFAVYAGALAITGAGTSSGVSTYYAQGYSTGKGSPYNFGYADTLEGNASCSNYWNQYVNGTGENQNLEGQPLQDYISGWIAGCENAPYGQSGVDVPGSNQGPNNPDSPYPASEGQ